MIRSMTGFGDASSQSGGVHYFVELRSLNNKYFKAVMRLPEDLQSLEADFESALRRRVHRGTVTLTVRCSDTTASASHDINHEALRRYLDQIDQAGVSGRVHIDVASLLSLPGVLQPPADEEERLSQARVALLPLLDKACDGLIEMRQREGGTIVEDLDARRVEIAERLETIQVHAPGVIEQYERRLRTRIDALLAEAGVSIEPVDIIKEIGAYVERTDIAEEISRLGAHVVQFETMLRAEDGKPIGRTMDFLAQEMLREANTIASKSPDAEIARLIVEVKGAIDRIKEQAANIE